MFNRRVGMRPRGGGIPAYFAASDIKASETAFRVKVDKKAADFSRYLVKSSSLKLLDKVPMSTETRKLCMWAMVLMRKNSYKNAAQLRKDFAKLHIENKIKNPVSLSTITRVIRTLKSVGIIEEAK